MSTMEPVLRPVAIADLKPTQITVGMREVAERRRHWREIHGKRAKKFLGAHMMPVILGPRGRHYIIDHHHLALALHQERVTEVLVTVVADLSRLGEESFWFMMDNRGWMHPFDARGRRRGYADLPKTVRQLVDDPYRSLAGELRRVGGFAKDTTPFSEFLWADFLRHRIKPARLAKNFTHSIEEALALAQSAEADYLPGWCGPAPQH